MRQFIAPRMIRKSEIWLPHKEDVLRDEIAINIAQGSESSFSLHPKHVTFCLISSTLFKEWNAIFPGCVFCRRPEINYYFVLCWSPSSSFIKGTDAHECNTHIRILCNCTFVWHMCVCVGETAKTFNFRPAGGTSTEIITDNKASLALEMSGRLSVIHSWWCQLRGLDWNSQKIEITANPDKSVSWN